MITEEHKKYVRDLCDKYGTEYIYQKFVGFHNDFMAMNIKDYLNQEILDYIIELERTEYK